MPAFCEALNRPHSTARVAPWGAEPYRLWSLLDMLQFHATLFCAVIGNLDRAMSFFTMDNLMDIDSGGGLPKSDSLQSVDNARNTAADLIAILDGLPVSDSVKFQAE